MSDANIIKFHSERFENAKREIANFSERTQDEIYLPRVDETGFFPWSDYDVTGEDYNKLARTIQNHLIKFNALHKDTINEFKNIYDAFDSLDKEYINGILIAVKAAEKNSKEAKEISQSVKDIQNGLKKTVENDTKIIDILKEHHEKINRYQHLDNIDEIWANGQTTLKRLNKIETIIKSTTLAGYGIKNAYTKTEVDNAIKQAIKKKADKDTVFTKQETETKLEGKSDKATTLAGYGIEDAYTKTATDDAISKAIENKADKDSVFTKQETETKLKEKAGKATTLTGYGIKDAYTKTEADGAISKAIENKADKDSVFTKQETETKLKEKAVKATTLAGYGIEDAFTKAEINATLETKATKSELTEVKQNIEKTNLICKELTEENERNQDSLVVMHKKIKRLYCITAVAIAICILQFVFMYQRLA